MTRHLRTSRATAPLLVLALVLAGCSDDGGDDGTATTSTLPSGSTPGVRQPALEGTIRVAAADTMADAMPVLVERFNEVNPGVQVEVVLDSASVLAMRIADGERADVFISSDTDNMGVVVGSGRVDGAPVVAARNRLVIVTAAGSGAGVEGPVDLEQLDEVALCEAATPCGAVADAVLGAEGVDLDGSVDRLPTGSEALAAVLAGEADAALVFASTAEGAGDSVDVVALDSPEAATDHPVAALEPAANSLAARAFVDFLLGSDGAQVLEDHGFDPVT